MPSKWCVCVCVCVCARVCKCVCMMRGLLDHWGTEFATAGWYKGKFYGLTTWGWRKQWEILLVLILLACWFDWYWRELKLRKSVTKVWIHVFPWLVSGGCCLVSLSLTIPKPQKPPQQTHTPSFTFPTILLSTIAELLGMIPQKLREMTIRIIFWRACI